MASLVVLHKPDASLTLVAATENAQALARSLNASLPFGVEVFAEFPGQSELLPLVQGLLGVHNNGWHITDATSAVKAVCLAATPVGDPQSLDPTSDTDTSQQLSEPPPLPKQTSSPESDALPQAKPGRSRNKFENAAVAEKEAVEEPCKKMPNRSKIAATLQAANVDPSWHLLLAPCQRDEADTATAIRKTLKRQLGRWQADSVLSQYNERILRIGGNSGRYILNAEGATMRLANLP